jgi:hypothetical protein
MDFKLIVGLIVLSVVVLGFAIPTVSNIISTTGYSGSTTESWSGTGGVFYSLTYPIVSVQSNYKTYAQTLTNATVLPMSVGNRSFTLSTPYYNTAFGVGIMAQKDAGDTIGVFAGSCSLGNFSGSNFTGISAACQTNPQVIRFVNYGPLNRTGVNYNDSGKAIMIGTTPITVNIYNATYGGTYNLSIESEFDGESNITVSVGGHILGNITSDSESWLLMPNADLSMATTDVLFISDGAGTNITNVSFKYTQSMVHPSNITSVSLTYQNYTAYPNYTVSGGNIRELTSGSYLTGYTYGTSYGVINTILAIIPVLFAVLLIIAIAALLV